MLSAPIHQVMMAERGARDERLRASDPGTGATTAAHISVIPPSPQVEHSVTLPSVSKTGRMHTLRVS